MDSEDKIHFRLLARSPILFIAQTWGLIPQPLKPECIEEVRELIDAGRLSEINVKQFDSFIRGKHITWQQWVILLAVERAIANKAPKRIAIRSGHGVGKDCTLAWLIFWYLFTRKNSQIPCTAPTADQLYDVLWKEIAKWHKLMPARIHAQFEWSMMYLRFKHSPETWFARARTAKKEQPEALAGVHSQYVFYVADEASGIPDEVFNTAEGSLTTQNILFMMISNPTRLLGYFYYAFHRDEKLWQTLAFSSIDSPIVDKEYNEGIKAKFGEDSDEYKIRVLGEFPRADAIDDRGYVPLLLEEDLKQIEDTGRLRNPRMGVDPSGEGDDETVWVIRDSFKAKLVAKEKISNAKSIAQKTITLMDFYEIPDTNVFVDNFGVGANVAQELGLAGLRVNGVNVGEKADDTDRFVNKRAENFIRVKEWLRLGGELIQNNKWKELLTIRYRRELSGKVKIMSKDDMRKDGIPSPNVADALMLTFYQREGWRQESKQLENEIDELCNVY